MIKKFVCFVSSQSMLTVVLLLIVGCAPVISKQVREQVRPDVTFEVVLNDPECYKGQMILLSGVIIETENTKEGTLLQILQCPPGFRGKPKDTDKSEGRFLALDNRYLDTNVFTHGRALTVAGVVQGKRILPLNKTEYAYPLIYVKELYLWPDTRRYDTPSPSVHIGFGVGYSH
ncbi:hypothetical protein BIY37_07785 [Candidatus Brocadia sapporoensis]|uniref:Outer membrane lipoprotein Slp n=1 Tax=Candidatus Brocadia sapporoensis TaxID=392547 RepID=A0A1V6LZJ0_9BACT|nr:Slp family lipoprotein [Candidatus Brocadia sapporoensis]MDG6005251.1 hypothetical protein [Candidatus Brocadia sp.]OQD45594.1 hypothetical protein BIY37_07785 [Candidatus Brocadia sapporoensis]GJQ24001.1 MAG: membrane protein [Candidatus Brocadia sapporoensis]